ncbi:tRNA (adenosine(37)-N6)-dimethylallyltransferase MiaA, partial [Candidatus Roizmanbacteria bacterium]|nr:tRNA (adenosine(37)-N6)-dimethylallyltransferase MiaA [Candidatus Roizmanbacteria bacterium]
MHRIYIITGQTATGKTDLGIRIAQKENGQLVNFDSRQIYKHLDIVTGKDNKNDVLLYDIVDPKDTFSSYNFKTLALDTLKKLIKKKKTPILVGGTYYYLKQLLYSVTTEKIPADFTLRRKLANISLQQLQEKVAGLNPDVFKNLNNSDKKNPHRLMRKIEILTHAPNIFSYKKTSRMILSELLGLASCQVVFLGLAFANKQKLIQAIENRINKRLQAGALTEVKKLLKMGYSAKDPGLNAIGYKQLIAYLKGDIDLKTAITDWKYKEIQYAKRQLTF